MPRTPVSAPIQALRAGAATRYLPLFPQVNAGSGAGSVAATSLGAATSIRGGDPVRLIVAVVLLAAVYGGACWLSPVARCLLCRGLRMRRTRILRRFVECRWCDASGRRLRVGRRAWNYFASIYRESAR